MKTVLVTGASGFIGRHLVPALVGQGCRVHCLVRRTSSVRHLVRAGADLRCGDITDAVSLRQALAGADTVFHLAGLTRALRADDFRRVNGQGTWNIAQACARQATPPVLVLVSSLAAAGPARPGAVRQEADPPAPVSNYGRSKRAGELAAEAWAAQVPTTIVRPGMVFGPADREMLEIFRTIAQLRIHFIPTFSPPPLSMIHVQDLVQLLILAAEKGRRLAGSRANGNGGAHGQGYYFASAPEYPTYVQLGRLIARSLGYRHVCLLNLAEPLPWIVAGVADLVSRLRGQPLALSLDKIREAITDSWACSTAAARRDLGFEPLCNLRQRLQETTDWYRARRWL